MHKPAREVGRLDKEPEHTLVLQRSLERDLVPALDNMVALEYMRANSRHKEHRVAVQEMQSPRHAAAAVAAAADHGDEVRLPIVQRSVGEHRSVIAMTHVGQIVRTHLSLYHAIG